MAGRSVYVCQACGYRSSGWLGRCPECGAWSSLVEEVVETTRSAKRRRSAAPPIVRLDEVESEAVARSPTGFPSLDRVLGGGVVAGGTVLVAGEPGIGKSTLLLQLAAAMSAGGGGVVYVSAEESPRQLRLRAERLGVGTAGVEVAGGAELEGVLAALDERAPALVLVDSIQALRSAELDSPPGSIGQVRHSAHRLVDQSKLADRALFLVGHVTKEGAIAGPKALEHLVDTVLTFEGERESDLRLLRASKNRFGPTGELALFEMHDNGLLPVEDPSGVLLARRRTGAPGSAILPTLSGTRPLLVEAQALANPSSFATPRRMSVGLDANRVVLLIAVLERFARLGLADRDVFLNMVGGIAVREPAADLAVAAALISAYRGAPLPADAVFFGEVGLLGEVRPVGGFEARVREAATHGFRRAYVAAQRLGGRRPGGVELIELETVEELAAAIGG